MVFDVRDTVQILVYCVLGTRYYVDVRVLSQTHDTPDIYLSFFLMVDSKSNRIHKHLIKI